MSNNPLQPDAREEKLPLWLQQTLRQLRSIVERKERELHALKEGTEPTRFWIEDWADRQRFYLPRHYGRLCFDAGGTMLYISEGTNGRSKLHLEINGARALRVAPWAENLVTIEGEP